FSTIEFLENGADTVNNLTPVVYVGDTVADMYTVQKAREIKPNCTWIGVGVLPPHVQETAQKSEAYTELLKKAGAAIVLSNVQELIPEKIQELILKVQG
ncbi:MAG: TIGR01548 family HAD-type hydrolase, partial [Cyanobacteria bacterium J06649_11]